MSDVPDELVLRRHRDLVGRERRPWTRRIMLGLVALVLVLPAANLFGQRPSTSTASGGRIDGGLGADDAPRRRVLDGALPRARDGIFAFLLFMTRIVGRREPSSLEPFDLILLIVIGGLVQQGVTQSDHSLAGAILAAGTFGVLTVVVSYLSFRFVRLRRSSRASR